MLADIDEPEAEANSRTARPTTCRLSRHFWCQAHRTHMMRYPEVTIEIAGSDRLGNRADHRPPTRKPATEQENR